MSDSVSNPVKSEIKTREVVYAKHKGKDLVGFIAEPANAKNAPVVLVVHEWWGQTDYPRKRAKMLAELGYIGMAIDMYGNRSIAKHPKDAQAFMMETLNDITEAEARFKSAMDYAKRLSTADSSKVAAIGYCYGGAVVLHMARKGYDLDGVASFHGSLGTKTPAKKSQVKAKVAVFNGAADPMVAEASIKGFKNEMTAAGVDFKFVNYPDAKHGFTNPEATKKGEMFKLPLAYQKEADEKSWSALQTFLKDVF
ncbi:MAG: dienelactone hydrolase family protein [Pseudobacteriovorax sp.]|nr:dienelactone hydrolase family protein [Pseudobacteriovorax sp.]